MQRSCLLHGCKGTEKDRPETQEMLPGSGTTLSVLVLVMLFHTRADGSLDSCGPMNSVLVAFCCNLYRPLDRGTSSHRNSSGAPGLRS